MKKGFTLIELAVSTALLGIIMSAVTALFVVGIKNYQVESQRSFLQKEVNFVADDIAIQAKQAYAVPETYDIYARSADTLILALPAINESENFIYSGNNLATDYIIYYLADGSLYKKMVADTSSTRADRETEIISNVSSFNCLYTPFTDTQEIDCTLVIAKDVGSVTLDFTAQKTAKLRNK